MRVIENKPPNGSTIGEKAVCVGKGRYHADGKPANRTAGAVLRKAETPAV